MSFPVDQFRSFRISRSECERLAVDSGEKRRCGIRLRLMHDQDGLVAEPIVDDADLPEPGLNIGNRRRYTLRLSLRLSISTVGFC
jgi:hypothetical protein